MSAPVLHHHDLIQNPKLESFIYSVNQHPIWERLKLINASSQSNPYPRFIYKYRPLNNNELDVQIKQLRDYVVESKLWLSSPLAFNDPFDMRGSFTFEGTPQSRRKHLLHKLNQYRPDLSKKQKELAVSNFLAEGPFTKTLESVHEKLREKVGVCSFAGNARNILMWAHYASNHSGVCLQFQIAADISIFTRAVSVDYSCEYPVVDYFEDIQKSFIPTLFQKSTEWKYEAEQRIVHPSGANCYLTFQPSALNSLILGCQLEEKSEIAIKQLLLERHENGLPPIRVFRSHRHGTKYCLRLVRQQNWPYTR